MSMLRTGVSVALGVSLVLLTRSPVLCELSRHFYEDEKAVTPPPGAVATSPGSEVEALGQAKLVDGNSVRSSSSLEAAVRSGRLFVASSAEKLASYVDNGYAKYQKTEHSVTSTASLLHDRSEDLLPNAVYVLVAAMSGNIAARQRGVFAKMTFPVLFGAAAFRYLLPNTFANTMDFAWRIEQQKLPQIAKQQLAAVESAREVAQSVESATRDGQRYIDGSVESLKRSIAEATGVDVDADARK